MNRKDKRWRRGKSVSEFRVIFLHTFSLYLLCNVFSALCVWAWRRRSPVLSQGSRGRGSGGSFEASQSAPAGLRWNEETYYCGVWRRPHGLYSLQLFDLLSPVSAASVMTLRTSSSMGLLLHSSSHDPRIPYWPARARSCFWLGTTKPITYVSSLQGWRRRGGGVSKRGEKKAAVIKWKQLNTEPNKGMEHKDVHACATIIHRVEYVPF